MVGGRMIYAGPFIGEFGWELMCWQAHLRYWASRGRQIAVGVHPSHRALYEDFATKIYSFIQLPAVKPNAMTAEGVDWETYRALVPKGYEWLRPIDVTLTEKHGCMTTVPQLHKSFVIPSEPKRYDLCIHARNRTNNGTDNRNWPHWDALMRQIPAEWKVAFIGTKDEAIAHHRGHDFRGVVLHDLIEIMNRSRLVVGPSSGPMHLAALCEVPHLVWSGQEKDWVRYAEVWNPFRTKHTMLRTWQPTVEQVLEMIHEHS